MSRVRDPHPPTQQAPPELIASPLVELTATVAAHRTELMARSSTSTVVQGRRAFQAVSIGGASPVGRACGPGVAVGERISEGGMGYLHAGRQLSLARTVAIKTARTDGGDEGAALLRLVHEARIESPRTSSPTPSLQESSLVACAHPFEDRS